MGQQKNGGYSKLDTQTGQQSSVLNQLLSMAPQLFGQAQQGYSQFLPGGGGGKAIQDAAQQRFQQQTIPSILNAFGSGSKSNSALNQALAAGGANLNTDLASQLSQMQLQAAQGAAGLGQSAAGLGSKDQFAYAPTQAPFWQDALLAAIQGGSKVGAAALGGI
jgi:hypothetical protein